MLAIPETKPFLDNEVVNERLRHSLANWLKMLFKPHSKEDVENYINRQKEIGNVHARINIPIDLVNYAFRILKRECFQRLIKSANSDCDRVNVLLLINELLDASAALINESYINDMVINERNAQSLRMSAISHSLAIECERLRSLLFDWLRKVLTTLHQEHPEDVRQLPSLYASDFGLWVMYKADLMFADYQDVVGNLKKQIQQIEESLQKVVAFRIAEAKEDLALAVTELNDHVTHAAWLLSSFVEHALEMENVRDPLTRLFNRRYLPTIMQYAIRIHIKHHINFAVLEFDIDHFKEINDTYGHDGGDNVLTQFGELLATNVRAGDFVFRYGGEEFLILLNGVDEKNAQSIAEKLRILVEQHTFIFKQSTNIKVTTSVGVAIHDGHPDYSRIISRADQALYQAKTSGRNCVVMAPLPT
jgi:diguanylate cyclase